MTATSLAKAGPTEERVEDFALRDGVARRFRDLRRGMKFPEVRMKDLLYGEKEGLTSGGGDTKAREKAATKKTPPRVGRGDVWSGG